MATAQKRSRQARVLDILQAQLERGTKRTKEGKEVKLTDKDVKRINSEIKTLKTRV